MCEKLTTFGTLELSRLVGVLASMKAASDDSERIDRIRYLEEVKSAAAAAQVAETAAFVASQRADQAAAGMPARRVGRGVSAQVGLARRVSPFHAQRYCGWSTILTTELPCTFAALQQGRVSEWRAMIVARETAWLSREHRRQVDAELGPLLDALSDRQVEARARTLGYELDPHGYLDRLAAAEADRRVSVRPAPDVMARLSALLPVAQAVAAYAALGRHADSCIAQGDSRSRGQLMADTLVERLTGQAAAGGVPIEINLIMTDEALLGDLVPFPTDETVEDLIHDDATGEDSTVDEVPAKPSVDPEPDPVTEPDPVKSAGRDEPVILLGHGPVPAGWARSLIFDAGDGTPIWLRRLYRHPTTGQLAAMDSRRRLFTPAMRHFVRLRDQDTCRTPYCDAPLRHVDHVRPADERGRTSVANAQGLCAACNYAKQAPGWRFRPTGHRNEISFTVPTGHSYDHRPPELPLTRPRTRSPAWPRSRPADRPRVAMPKINEASPVERRCAELLWAA